MTRDIAAPLTDETLPGLIDRAAQALMGARTSAEVLEARDMARMAYDAARSAGRMARAKAAHDEVIAAVYRAQADAAVIEARAKIRLADEYDAAQARGEVASDGRPKTVGDDNGFPATAADLGLRRDEIHEARKLRDAEAAQPGRIEAAAQALVERGEEPTKAALRREVIGPAAPAPAPAPAPDDPDAAERRNLAKLSPDALIEDVLGLRAALAEERGKRREAERRVAELRDELAEERGKRREAERRVAELRDELAILTAGDDMGRKLGAALEELRRTRGRLAETQAALARETRRANGLEKALKRLEAQRAAQEIPLGGAA